MASLKNLISPPLEAGESILRSQQLPPHATQALEYISKRLARKGIQPLTLVAVRRDYQLPNVAAILPPSPAPSSALSSAPTSPGMFTAPSPSLSAFTKPASMIKNFVRPSHHHSTSISSATWTVPDAVSPRSRWPMSPGSPNSVGSYSSTPGTPSTQPPTPRNALHGAPPTPRSPPFFNPLAAHPLTPRTPATPSTISPPTPRLYTPSGLDCMRFVYAIIPNLKEERVLRHIFSKAEKKFGVRGTYTPLQYHSLPADLLCRSLYQNEVLFSSEGITILALDRLYTFKAALAAYTRAPHEIYRLEDTVDELRRLVLASRHRSGSVIGSADEEGRVDRSFLMRSYDFLGVTTQALRDAERAYTRTYCGGDMEDDMSGRASDSSMAHTESQALSEDRDCKQRNIETKPAPIASTLDVKNDDIPDPISPLKDPRSAPLPPTLHTRRKASPLPPTVAITQTSIKKAVQSNRNEMPQSASPPRTLPSYHQAGKSSPRIPQYPLIPRPTYSPDQSSDLKESVVIPPNAAVNMRHRPQPSALSPIHLLPISSPSPLASPGKGPALRVQTTFQKSLSLPLQPKSPIMLENDDKNTHAMNLNTITDSTHYQKNTEEFSPCSASNAKQLDFTTQLQPCVSSPLSPNHSLSSSIDSSNSSGCISSTFSSRMRPEKTLTPVALAPSRLSPQAGHCLSLSSSQTDTNTSSDLLSSSCFVKTQASSSSVSSTWSSTSNSSHCSQHHSTSMSQCQPQQSKSSKFIEPPSHSSLTADTTTAAIVCDNIVNIDQNSGKFERNPTPAPPVLVSPTESEFSTKLLAAGAKHHQLKQHAYHYYLFSQRPMHSSRSQPHLRKWGSRSNLPRRVVQSDDEDDFSRNIRRTVSDDELPRGNAEVYSEPEPEICHEKKNDEEQKQLQQQPTISLPDEKGQESPDSSPTNLPMPNIPSLPKLNTSIPPLVLATDSPLSTVPSRTTAVALPQRRGRVSTSTRGGYSSTIDSILSLAPMSLCQIRTSISLPRSSTEFLLSAGGTTLLSKPGPVTPNGYEDISPITRGEWGFLVSSSEVERRRAAVEIF